MTAYAELAVTTNFSFLRGGSHPEEFVDQAARLGLWGLGICDRNSLAGVVRAFSVHREWRERAGKDGPPTQSLKLAIGARLVFVDGTPDILAYPQDRAAYGRLCRLLTLGNSRGSKGTCTLRLADLPAHADGLQLILMPASSADATDACPDEGFSRAAQCREAFVDSVIERLKSAAEGRLWLAATMTYAQAPRRSLALREELAHRHGLPLLAVGDVLYHAPERRPLQDVLTCIRHGVTLDAAGRRLEANAERHLKGGPEMARLFAEAPGAVAETLRFLKGLTFSLKDLAYEYPDEPRPGFATPQAALEALTWAGARKRYGARVPPKVARALIAELAFIARKDYAPYFLTIHDIVRFARDEKILCQGRGSAANSAVCFCLGITEVDPDKHELLFARFLSDERDEPPDVDVDFEHERRDEVMRHIYGRYGADRVSLVATVIRYRARSAVRDVGKAFGLSQDTIAALSGTIWGWSAAAVETKEVVRLGFDPTEPRLAKVLALCAELCGFPRHLSQHVGGFVITRSRLDDVMVIGRSAMEGRTIVEWDKDDLDALQMFKIDILALGMLSCLRRAFDLIAAHYGTRYTIPTIPAEEEPVYRMIQRADTLGVFQIESRAQMSMLPRLKPKEFYDLVIEVAIVRPGPIQGDMVHPYLRRRQKIEDVDYPSPELKVVLERTLGVPLFQEQAMQIAIVAAGFTPAEADRLRRAMATFRRSGTISKLKEKMIEGMVQNNYDRAFAERCFKQIEGFGEYGFPESHAVSFANLVYASSWIKARYPDVFCAALLNAQPMGFYAPAQIVRDAREHGVTVHHPDINRSDWDSTLEGEEGARPAERLHSNHADMRGDIWSTHAVRLGFRTIKGLSEAEVGRLMSLRGRGYDSVRDVWLRAELAPETLERLAEGDAFRSLGLDRRQALWAVKALRRSGDKDDLPLLRAAALSESEPDADLPAMPLGEQVIEDYRHLALSLKAHPVALLRSELEARKVRRCEALRTVAQDARVTVAGLVLMRQRPGTARGVIFMTLEDETGIANVVVWPTLFEAFRPVILGARFTAVTGRVQRQGDVIHVVAERLEDWTPLVAGLSRLGHAPDILGRADEVKRPQPDARTKEPSLAKRLAMARLLREEPALRDDPAPEAEAVRRVLPKGRNFH